MKPEVFCDFIASAAASATMTFGFILDRDESKQIRPCTGSGAPAQNILMKLNRVFMNKSS